MKIRLILLLSLFLYGCSDEGPQLKHLKEDAVILAFGNSLTYGTGVTPDESYPALLEKISNRKVINAGVPSELSAQGLERLPSFLEKYQPDLLILCHAGNDLLRKKDLNAAESNLIEMIELAQSMNIDVLLLGVPRPGLFLNTADLYFNAAEKTNTPLADDIVPAILADSDLKSDPVHPNKEGYRIMSEKVLEQLHHFGAFK